MRGDVERGMPWLRDVDFHITVDALDGTGEFTDITTRTGVVVDRIVEGWELWVAGWKVDWWCGGRDFGTARAGRNQSGVSKAKKPLRGECWCK